MMFKSFCKRKGLKREVFAGDTIQKGDMFDKIDIVCQLIGVDKKQVIQKKGHHFAKQANVQQKMPVFAGPPFVTREDYESVVKQDLITFLTELMKCMVGEENDISGWNSMMDNTRNRSRQDMTGELDEDKPPFILMIDNAHNMCPTSWQLLESIIFDCYRLVVILLVQSDEMDRMKIHQDSIETFESVYAEITEHVEEIVEKDLPRMSAKDFGAIIRSSAQKYRSTYTNEMKDMTRIIDPKKTLKTEEMGIEWRQILTEKWQLSTNINEVDMEILKLITAKCRGNPLLGLQYFVNLLHNGFIEVINNG